MELLQALAFVLLALSCLIRIPALLRGRGRWTTWGATFSGSAALLTLGVVIPQTDLDAILGGRNWIKLVQICLATIAFWLTAKAASQSVGRPTFAVSIGALSFMLLLIVVPFSLTRLDQATSPHFLEQNIGQTSLWLSSSFYMVSIVMIASALVVALRRVKGARAGTMAIGAGAAAIASLVEAVALTAAHFGADAVPVKMGFFAFNLLFYIGLVLVAASIMLLSLGRVSRRRHIARLNPALDRILSRIGGYEGLGDSGAIAELWDRFITIRDLQTAGGVLLSDLDEEHMRRAERLINRQFADPLVAFQVRSTQYTPMPGAR